MAETLEARRGLFRRAFNFDDAAYHSTMALCHAILKRISSNSAPLLQVTDCNLCGLAMFAMSLSAHITDDESPEYCQRMLNLIGVKLQDVRIAQCHWVNLYHSCGDNCEVRVLGV